MILKIADRIKELRELNNLTQSELARKLQLSRTSINAWEMGTSIPTTEKIPDICLILHTTSDYLLGIQSDDVIPIHPYTHEEKEILLRLTGYFDEMHEYYNRNSASHKKYKK